MFPEGVWRPNVFSSNLAHGFERKWLPNEWIWDALDYSGVPGCWGFFRLPICKKSRKFRFSVGSGPGVIGNAPKVLEMDSPRDSTLFWAQARSLTPSRLGITLIFLKIREIPYCNLHWGGWPDLDQIWKFSDHPTKNAEIFGFEENPFGTSKYMYWACLVPNMNYVRSL